jgi:hypothetical protein
MLDPIFFTHTTIESCSEIDPGKTEQKFCIVFSFAGRPKCP